MNKLDDGNQVIVTYECGDYQEGEKGNFGGDK